MSKFLYTVEEARQKVLVKKPRLESEKEMRDTVAEFMDCLKPEKLTIKGAYDLPLSVVETLISFFDLDVYKKKPTLRRVSLFSD